MPPGVFYIPLFHSNSDLAVFPVAASSYWSCLPVSLTLVDSQLPRQQHNHTDSLPQVGEANN